MVVVGVGGGLREWGWRWAGGGGERGGGGRGGGGGGGTKVVIRRCDARFS